jgi:hypothetical protein
LIQADQCRTRRPALTSPLASPCCEQAGASTAANLSARSRADSPSRIHVVDYRFPARSEEQFTVLQGRQNVTLPDGSQPPRTGSGTTLHLVSESPNVDPATPAKRTGKSMSRRTGQTGHIEKSGKWWVVRWWMDVAGQEKRAHKRARICPISGPGALSKSARERRCREIIAESGADSEEYFNKVVKHEEHGVTFREQAVFWIEQVKTRKRKPVAVSTLELWNGCLRNWLNPQIGD